VLTSNNLTSKKSYCFSNTSKLEVPKTHKKRVTISDQNEYSPENQERPLFLPVKKPSTKPPTQLQNPTRIKENLCE